MCVRVCVSAAQRPLCAPSLLSDVRVALKAACRFSLRSPFSAPLCLAHATYSNRLPNAFATAPSSEPTPEEDEGEAQPGRIRRACIRLVGPVAARELVYIFPLCWPVVSAPWHRPGAFCGARAVAAAV